MRCCGVPGCPWQLWCHPWQCPGSLDGVCSNPSRAPTHGSPRARWQCHSAAFPLNSHLCPSHLRHPLGLKAEQLCSSRTQPGLFPLSQLWINGAVHPKHCLLCSLQMLQPQSYPCPDHRAWQQGRNSLEPRQQLPWLPGEIPVHTQHCSSRENQV